MKHAQSYRAGRLGMPRSRGAISGVLLVILGAWGALIPFIGPHFNFAYTPDQAWTWTSARGWFEVFPGVATLVGGLLLIASKNRASAMIGGWLAVAGGAWFVVGGQIAPLLQIGAVGDPVATTERKKTLLEITYFSGLGALIVFLGGVALARLAVRHARDVVPVEPPHEELVPAASAPADSYVEPVGAPAEPVSSGAVTKARTGGFRQGFRRHREGAPANAYGRLPHPQP
jgi:hypothetical protein